MAQKDCVLDLTLHTEAVYDMTWAPRDASSKGPRILATASFDTSVRLWDADTGECLRVLSRHTEAVYTVAFNPTGTHIATGSPDHTINIWRVQVNEKYLYPVFLMIFSLAHRGGLELILFFYRSHWTSRMGHWRKLIKVKEVSLKWTGTAQVTNWPPVWLMAR